MFKVALLICCLLALSLVVAEKITDYGVMVDAGSSGTRVFLYSWDHREAPAVDTIPPFSRPIAQETYIKKVPLTDFIDNRDGLDPFLVDLIAPIKGKLNTLKISDRIGQIPFFIGATAGLRKVSISDREDLMNRCRIFLKKSGFLFHNSYAKVLSGEEEALFGWISANYLMDKFSVNEVKQVIASVDSSSPIRSLSDNINQRLYETDFLNSVKQQLGKEVSTYGVMDLGGASTQITFEATNDLMAHFLDYVGPNNSRYSLYSISHLDFGANRATDRLIESVVKNAEPESSVPHPCYNTGFTRVVDQTKNISIHGTSDIAGCQKVINDLFYKGTHCFTDNCSINGIYQPHINTDLKFVGISAFSNILSLVGIPAGDVAISTIVDHKNNKICNQSWENLKSAFPEAAKGPYLAESCAMFYYIEGLLVEAYGLPKQSSILFASSHNGVELNWALGRMVYEASAMEYDRILNSNSTNVTPYIVCIVVLTALMLVFAFLLYKSKYMKSNTVIFAGNNDYVQLDK